MNATHLLLGIVIALQMYIIRLLTKRKKIRLEKMEYYKLPNMFDRMRERSELIAKDVNEAIKKNSNP